MVTIHVVRCRVMLPVTCLACEALSALDPREVPLRAVSVSAEGLHGLLRTPTLGVLGLRGGCWLVRPVASVRGSYLFLVQKKELPVWVAPV